MGGQGMPRRYFNYLDQFQPIHAFSTYGSWVLGAGLFMTAIYLLASLKTGPLAPDNPWGGTTMEWESSSPPVVHNFEEQPVFEHEPYDYRHRTVTHV
jgi:cytochrome c oxidase subunit 1